MPNHQNGCWVHVFDGPVFSGQLRHFRGPTPSPVCIADKNQCIGSIIVGPRALAKLQWRRGSHTERRTLRPRLVLGELTALGFKGKPAVQMHIYKAVKVKRVAA